MEIMNNKVSIIGEIVSDFVYSHEVCHEKFYAFNVSVARFSGYVDVIPTIISERLINVKQSYVGQYVNITGQFRSYNKHEESGSKLVLYVFAQECKLTEVLVTGENGNGIELEGYICKEVKYKTTPLGREITELLLAVNRAYGKTDYIPCIVWGRNARFAADFTVGEHIRIWGRIQSREYVKRLDGKNEKRTAYEVSVGKLEVAEVENGN